jgi:hypothetical protein
MSESSDVGPGDDLSISADCPDILAAGRGNQPLSQSQATVPAEPASPGLCFHWDHQCSIFQIEPQN